MVNSREKNQCCGCSACEQMCPKNAISMKMLEEGFCYPEIDMAKCVDCGLCDRVCPFDKSYVGEEATPLVYAALHKNEEVRKKSSSGGVYSAITDYILERGGVVYGVKYDADFSVKHDSAETKEKRDCFRGSKYVQSNVNNTYVKVEDDLAAGRDVLFSGTPCQVEGLNRYLQLKKADTSKLITVDNICHGVASPGIWHEYLDELNKLLEQDEKIEYISMRSKESGWRKQEMIVLTNKRDISKMINENFSWNRLYLSLLTTRSSCFECKFTSYKRVADITLADFWNYENAGIELNDTYGISLILVNRKKGEELFDVIKSQLDYVQSDVKKCWQIHLQFTSNLPVEYEKFWKQYREEGGVTVLKKYTKGTFTNRLIRFVSPMLRKVGLYQPAIKVYSMLGKKKNGK